MLDHYLPAWATAQEASEWLEAETGQAWPLVRLLETVHKLSVWIDCGDDEPDYIIEGLFQGRREGFRAEVIFGSDLERLKFVRDGGTLHISRRPDGALVKFTPPIKFPVDELRFEADCVRQVATIVGATMPLSEPIKQGGASAGTKAGIKRRPQTNAEKVAAARHAASVNVSSRGHWPPRQTSKPQGIDWGHWAKLREVRVYEALALLDGQEPPENCPDADDESPTYRKRMRLLLDALPNREWFGPPTVNSGDPPLQPVNLAELGRWAKANGHALPDEFPCAVARAGAIQNSESASSDALATPTKPESSRITICEAKRRIRKSSPHELFIDFYVSGDGTLTAVPDGVPKSIFAGHLDEDFAGNCKKLGIVPTWKYRPGKTGYTGDPTTDDLYTITQGELDQLASLYGLSLGVGTPPPQEFVTSPRPSCIPPKLQELDSSATVKAVFDMGGMNGWCFPTAAEYIAEIQERIERQAQDLFTVAEAAQVLAIERPSKDGKAWVQEMRAAHCTGALAIRDESQIPFKPLRPADNAVIPNTWTAAQTMPRHHADLVKGADVNSWLRATAGYGFPEADLTPTTVRMDRPEVDVIDYSTLATREKLIDVFGKLTGMNDAWFVNLTHYPGLLAARKIAGTGGRKSIRVEPWFCPFRVMLWLTSPRRKAGRPLSTSAGWRLLKSHFPNVYDLHQSLAPDLD